MWRIFAMLRQNSANSWKPAFLAGPAELAGEDLSQAGCKVADFRHPVRLKNRFPRLAAGRAATAIFRIFGAL
ncbi:MAG: hypothetical protein ACP5SH_05115 [Syntrophobacteraceae bacterium]